MRVVIPEQKQLTEEAGTGMSRRRFLKASATAGAVGMGVAGCAFGPNASAVELSRHEVPVAGLDPSLSGIRIAQFTDTHFPANHRAAERALAMLAEEKPEIVIHTGDMVEGPGALSDLASFCASARGTLHTVAIRGNWELSAGIASKDLAQVYQAAGVEYLQNQVSNVRVGQGTLAIAGLDDTVLGRPDLHGALARIEANTVVWAMHGPGFADDLPADTPAHLLLAGHTHGGQIRLPFVPPMRPSGSGRFLAGWYKTLAAPLYVSRGVGTTSIRARFMCPPELPIFTLVPARA